MVGSRLRPGGPAVARDLDKYWDAKSRVARSTTGELTWDAARGLEPVGRARTLLVTAVGPVRNTGMEYERTAQRAARFDGPLWKLVSSGQPPMLMRAVTGEVCIRTARAGGLKAWALDVNGKRTGAVPLEFGESFVRLKLTAAGAAPYYELGR
jgi:hypothetical protein